jgi:hypothetical protein
MVRRSLAGALTALAALTLAPSAAAYPVDCAILLCIAGGFPPSEPCLRAKAVMMQRILSIPFQPPLQIWNCPIRASTASTGDLAPITEVSTSPDNGKHGQPDGLLQLIGGTGTDISGPEFAFLRSLRVIRLEYHQQGGKEGACTRESRVAIGRYDDEAVFTWSGGHTRDVPASSDFQPRSGCTPYAYRSIMIDWHDATGTYGFEEVRY